VAAAGAGVIGAGGVAVTGTAAAVAGPTHPMAQSAPPITPRPGRPFTPVQGDWDGTTRGLDASFELQYDPTARRYALTRLVVLRPAACPVDAARHSEFFLPAPARLALGISGSTRLAPAGLGVRLTGAQAATLTSAYRVGACAGTLSWRMRPVRRATVDDGTWSIRFGSGAPLRFDVGSGGRLARSVPLPPLPAGCAGLRGAVDLFIGPTGRASFSEDGVSLAMRFGPRSASGTFRIAGCAAATAPIRASATR
jgi:hypothetical protein